MPCYSVRTVSVTFQVGNTDLLKKALEKAGLKLMASDEKGLLFEDKLYNNFKIDFANSKISGQANERDLTTLSNSIKRAYSLEVISELALKQKWIQRKMGPNQYQLQRF